MSFERVVCPNCELAVNLNPAYLAINGRKCPRCDTMFPKAQKAWEPDSDAVWKLKGQMSNGLLKQGTQFFLTREYRELSEMLKAQDKKSPGSEDPDQDLVDYINAGDKWVSMAFEWNYAEWQWFTDQLTMLEGREP